MRCGTSRSSTDLRAPAMAGARTFRHRLIGRTPRSGRGDRGSTPRPGSTPRAGSSTGRAPLLQREGRWFEPSLAHFRRRIAQVAERLSDEEEAAGSTPAPPISRDRSSARKSARLKHGASQVRFLPVTSTRLRSSTRQSSRFLPGRLQVRGLPGPLAPLAGGPPGRRSRPPGRLAPPSAPGSPGLC